MLEPACMIGEVTEHQWYCAQSACQAILKPACVVGKVIEHQWYCAQVMEDRGGELRKAKERYRSASANAVACTFPVCLAMSQIEATDLALKHFLPLLEVLAAAIKTKRAQQPGNRHHIQLHNTHLSIVSIHIVIAAYLMPDLAAPWEMMLLLVCFLRLRTEGSALHSGSCHASLLGTLLLPYAQPCVQRPQQGHLHRRLMSRTWLHAPSIRPSLRCCCRQAEAEKREKARQEGLVREATRRAAAERQQQVHPMLAYTVTSLVPACLIQYLHLLLHDSLSHVAVPAATRLEHLVLA